MKNISARLENKDTHRGPSRMLGATKKEFGLVIGFIDHLYTTRNYK
jgi:hypothetical protein